MWREGRVTGDEILAWLRTRMPGNEVSRAGVYRYLSKYKRSYERIREAQDVAAHCIEQAGQNPRGNVGRLLSQLTSALALASLNERGEGPIESKELFFLSSAIRNLASAEKTSVDLEMRIRKEIAAVVNRRIEEARASGIDPAILERAKELVRGAING